MESLYLRIFALLFLSLAGACLGSSPTELYWKSVLPDSQMPKSLENLIRYDKRGIDKMVQAGKDPRDSIAASRIYATDESTFENTMKANKDASDHNTFLPGIKKDLYFLEKDLHPGRKIQVQLQKTPIGDITFLPGQVAEKVPFSSGKFPEILNYFSVKADSMEANIMKETIEACEKSAVGGEDKFCATSLESLVDMAVLKLGKGVRVLSSEVEKETQSEEFTILKGVKLMGENEVVCHKLKYPYAVFYCHSIEKTAVYGVPMVAPDGTRARAIAVCHKDTSSWNPNHVSFKLLKVKPGTVPICHFLFRETLIWLRRNSSARGMYCWRRLVIHVSLLEVCALQRSQIPKKPSKFSCNLLLALAGTCLGSLPAELHWKSVLPDTEMPKSLQNLLQSGNKEFLNEMLNAYLVKPAAIIYITRSNFSGIHKDSFFFEKDLHPGRKIEAFQFLKTALGNIAFLPAQVADKIPFSSDKFPEILKYFSLKTGSEEANVMKETIEICETPAIGGEKKFCATSLESMVDMAVATLGKRVRVLSTEVEKETQSKEFTILKGVKMMGEKEVACHKMKYPHAVFYCHSTEKTAVYGVPMVGSDGTRARAVAVCHKDTSSWSPKHVSFQMLNVKPGTVPICHFLPRETLIWLPKY